MQSLSRCTLRAARPARLAQLSRRYASDHAHHDAHAGPVNESFGKSFYLLLAALPTAYLVYNIAQPSPSGKPHSLTAYLSQFSTWQKTWEERNASHTKMVEQAGHDRNLFINASTTNHVEHRMPELLGNTGSPFNVKAGYKADLSELRDHLEGRMRKTEAEKIRNLGW